MSMSSFVWKFSKVNDSTDVHAECNLCHRKVKRGSKPKNFQHKHMANHHPIAYASAKKKKLNKKQKKLKQQLLQNKEN